MSDSSSDSNTGVPGSLSIVQSRGAGTIVLVVVVVDCSTGPVVFVEIGGAVVETNVGATVVEVVAVQAVVSKRAAMAMAACRGAALRLTVTGQQ
jgi:hypothetical protein